MVKRVHKRAKVITQDEFNLLVGKIRRDHGELALRDEVALRLSYYAGLRACEIAGLRWDKHLLSPTGKLLNTIHITGDIAKRSVERTIPMDKELARALRELRRFHPVEEFVFYAVHNKMIPTVPVMERGKLVRKVSPNYKPGRVQPNAVVQFFKRLYKEIGYKGCSSHSGRRTFITARARIANLEGCSIRDVQELAGHRSLETTAAYIEPSPNKHKLVSAWG